SLRMDVRRAIPLGKQLGLSQVLSPNDPDLVIIDSIGSPFAYIMTRAEARSRFDTWCFESDFASSDQILKEAARLTLLKSTPVIALIDKRVNSAALIPAFAAIGQDDEGANRMELLTQLAQEGLTRTWVNIGSGVELAARISMSAFAIPTGLGG